LLLFFFFFLLLLLLLIFTFFLFCLFIVALANSDEKLRRIEACCSDLQYRRESVGYL
jgi:hypothetical protein